MKASEEETLQMLERGPVTPEGVARELGVTSATAKGRLRKLVASGKVESIRKGKVNIYFLRYSSGLLPRMPSWVKAKPLRILSEELEPYFQVDVSAAEMVERGRRRD